MVSKKINRIRIDFKGKEEALRKQWQEIFKIQIEDSMYFDKENEQNNRTIY